MIEQQVPNFGILFQEKLIKIKIKNLITLLHRTYFLTLQLYEPRNPIILMAIKLHPRSSHFFL